MRKFLPVVLTGLAVSFSQIAYSQIDIRGRGVTGDVQNSQSGVHFLRYLPRLQVLSLRNVSEVVARTNKLFLAILSIAIELSNRNEANYVC